MLTKRIIKQKEAEKKRLESQNQELTLQRKILAEEVFKVRQLLNQSEADKIKYFETIVKINKLVL